MGGGGGRGPSLALAGAWSAEAEPIWKVTCLSECCGCGCALEAPRSTDLASGALAPGRCCCSGEADDWSASAMGDIIFGAGWTRDLLDTSFAENRTKLSVLPLPRVGKRADACRDSLPLFASRLTRFFFAAMRSLRFKKCLS